MAKENVKKFKWLKEQEYSEDFEVIPAKKHEDHRDFRLDRGSYLLIRTYPETNEIGVAVCDYRHNILKEFRGKRPQDIYHTLFEYSEKHNKNWFTRMDHAAYLGKELKKAELSLKLGFKYVQE